MHVSEQVPLIRSLTLMLPHPSNYPPAQIEKELFQHKKLLRRTIKLLLLGGFRYRVHTDNEAFCCMLLSMVNIQTDGFRHTKACHVRPSS